MDQRGRVNLVTTKRVEQLLDKGTMILRFTRPQRTSNAACEIAGEDVSGL
jgi:hypothetical protein